METGQPFSAKEVKYAQYLLVALALLSMIETAIYLVAFRGLLSLLDVLSTIATLAFSLFYVCLAWKLGRLRPWARAASIVLAVLSLLGEAGYLLEVLFFPGARSGSLLYLILVYGTQVANIVICLLLLYYLTRPPVFDAFQVRRPTASSPLVKRASLTKHAKYTGRKTNG